MKKIHILFSALVCAFLATAVQAKSFSWQGVTLDYPSGYLITDKEHDGETYDFCCEIDDDDIVSMINFSIAMDDDGDFEDLDEEGILGCLGEAVKNVCRGLQKETPFADLRFGSVESDSWGPYPRVSSDFSGKILGVLPLSGKVVLVYGKGKIVTMVLQADSRSNMQTLLGIVGSIRLE